MIGGSDVRPTFDDERDDEVFVSMDDGTAVPEDMYLCSPDAFLRFARAEDAHDASADVTSVLPVTTCDVPCRVRVPTDDELRELESEAWESQVRVRELEHQLIEHVPDGTFDVIGSDDGYIPLAKHVGTRR